MAEQAILSSTGLLFTIALMQEYSLTSLFIMLQEHS